MATETYKKRLQQGVCVLCGKVPPRKNGKRCLACEMKLSEQRHSRYVYHKGVERPVGRPRMEYAVMYRGETVFTGDSYEIAEFLGYSRKSHAIWDYIHKDRTTPSGYRVVSKGG